MGGEALSPAKARFPSIVECHSGEAGRGWVVGEGTTLIEEGGWVMGYRVYGQENGKGITKKE